MNMDAKNEQETKHAAEENKPKQTKKSKTEKVNVKDARKNKIWCSVCQHWLSSISFGEHLKGKKHKIKLKTTKQRKKQSISIAKKGLIVNDPPLDLKTEMILNYFQKEYGAILAVAKLGSNGVLVQFQDIAVAEKAKKASSHVIEGFVVATSPRPASTYDDNELKSPGKQQSKKPPLQQIVKNLRCPAACSLDDQLNMVVAAVQASEKSKAIKEHIVADLSDWLRAAFPHHDLLPFGSSVMGLDFDDSSDIDLYLRFDPDNWQTASEVQKKEILEKAYAVIRAHPSVKPDVLIQNARVPVAKFVHTKFGVKCDLSVDNIKGVMNSKFIASLLSTDSRIRPFLLVLKLWAKTNRLTGSDQGTITSYALTLLSIFFLQRATPPLVPPIASLQSQVPAEERKIYHGWDFSYALPQRKATESEIPQASLFTLLKGFFNFFQSFDPTDVVICPLIGDVVPRENFTSSPPALDESAFKPYIEYLHKGGTPLKFGQQLTVQDPFELNFNVCAGFIKYERFQALCKKAFERCFRIENAEGKNKNVFQLFYWN